MAKLTGLLSTLPAFDQMIQAQKALVAKAEAETAQAAAAAAQETAEANLRQTKLQSLVDMAYLIAAADGAVADAERETLATRMCEATNDALDAGQTARMLSRAKKKLDEMGQGGLLSTVATTLSNQDEREAAFVVAAAVSWKGGGIGAKEGLALQAIAKTFDWPIPEMHKLLAKAHG
jgi:tellurite resistance protein